MPSSPCAIKLSVSKYGSFMKELKLAAYLCSSALNKPRSTTLYTWFISGILWELALGIGY